MEESNELRIVVVGKSGCGKSSLANNILGEEGLFKSGHGSNTPIRLSTAHSRVLGGQRLTLVDTPGIFLPERPWKILQCEVTSCLSLCLPEPHAVLLVLAVKRFASQEQAMVDLIRAHFGGDQLFKFTIVVFTHGDQLPENMTISEFVRESQGLRELVDKCGGRCHVVDNRYWSSDRGDPLRSNKHQVKEILASVKAIAVQNGYGSFTSALSRRVEQEILDEQRRLQELNTELSQEESREQAMKNVMRRYAEEATRPEPRKSYVKLALVGIAAVGIVAVPLGVLFMMKELSFDPPPLPSPIAPDITPSLPSYPPLPVPVLPPPCTDMILPPLPDLPLPSSILLHHPFDEIWKLFGKTYNPFKPFE